MSIPLFQTSTLYAKARICMCMVVYGDDPQKWNEREPDERDALGINIYTYKPEINSIMQSGNLYVYCMGNPLMYDDSTGNNATFANPSLFDPNFWRDVASGGPVALIVGGYAYVCYNIGYYGTTAILNGIYGPPSSGSGVITLHSTSSLSGGVSATAIKPINLPSVKKIKIDMFHIINRHTVGGAGGPNKHRFSRKTIGLITYGCLL